MNPRDFLLTAADLILGNRESDWRSAVSRAYYGVFLAARDLFEACHFVTPPDLSVHAYIIDRLWHCGYRPLEIRADDLQKLRRFRNRGDYDKHIPFDHAVAVRQCDRADDIMAALDIALASPTILAAITTATTDYERQTFGSTTHRPPPPPTPTTSTP